MKYLEIKEKRANVNISEQVFRQVTRIVIEENKSVKLDQGFNIFKNSKGINVSFSENETCIIDVALHIIYGKNVDDIVKELQVAISEQIVLITGFEVEKVNITVTGIEL